MAFLNITETTTLFLLSRKRFLCYLHRVKSPWQLKQILWVCIFWCVFCIKTSGTAQTVQAHDIKALFLYNFASFVFWPSSAFESPTSPIRYCATGDSKVINTLTQLIDNEKVGGRSLTLHWVSTDIEMENCHILFLKADESGQFATARKVQKKGVLTVSDGENFAVQGGMISLVLDGNRVRPVINRDAVNAAQLRISAKLLRLAKLI